MFTNRRGRREVKKQVYNNTQLSINTGNVGIRRDHPNSALDVNGNVNTSKKYTINYVPIAPPVGSIMAYTMGISPAGWLICDGASYNIKIYSALFQVIGTTFGGLDNSFNVPNYQGTFLRGIGAAPSPNTAYVGPSNINTPQSHATQTHNHTASSSVTDPAHSHEFNTINDDFNGSGGSSYPANSKPSAAAYDSTGNIQWSISSGTISSHTTGVSVATSVNNSTLSVNANETRPYNYGVYWIIKY